MNNSGQQTKKSKKNSKKKASSRSRSRSNSESGNTTTQRYGSTSQQLSLSKVKKRRSGRSSSLPTKLKPNSHLSHSRSLSENSVKCRRKMPAYLDKAAIKVKPSSGSNRRNPTGRSRTLSVETRRTRKGSKKRETHLSPAQSVTAITRDKWVENIDNCSNIKCGIAFTTIKRRHHCRYCGNIFCHQCSSQKVNLTFDKEKKIVRVCLTCYDKIEFLGNPDTRAFEHFRFADIRRAQIANELVTSSISEPVSAPVIAPFLTPPGNAQRRVVSDEKKKNCIF